MLVLVWGYCQVWTLKAVECNGIAGGYF